MYKILLIYPPSKTQYHQSCPMGIQLLAAVLEKAGHEVHLLDANAVKRKMDNEQVIEQALCIQPDVIGITLLTPMIKGAYLLAEGLKQRGFKLLAGGPHATLMPEEAVNMGFDAAVIGEGESVIEDAVQALTGEISKETVKGWAYKDDNNVIKMTDPRDLIEDLDTVPYPARHMVDWSLYGDIQEGILHSNLFSSRGCTAKCSFCSGQLFGKRFRFRSSKSLLDEVENLYNTYGTKEFHFVDDAMTLNKKRLSEFCQGILDRKLTVRWSVMTRIDAVNEAFLKMISEAGCFEIDYGIESGHAETLRKIHKPHNVDMVRKVIPMTAKMGIRPNVFFILGFPWEDVSALNNTLGLMKEIAPYVSTFHPATGSILIPFPGTEIYSVYHKEYGFTDWWLSDDKNYDTLIPERSSYYESKVFHLGNILKADFFHYNEEVREKIYDIFEFMYFHNMSSNNSLKTRIKKSLLLFSRKLNSLSETAERMAFSPLFFASNVLAK